MIGFTTQNLKGKKLIHNGKKRCWKMESHMVASQPGSGSCSKRNLWGTKFSFTSVKWKKKRGNERGKNKNKEKYAVGNCQWDQSFVMLFIFSWNSRRSDIPCPGFELSDSFLTSPHVVSLRESDCPSIIRTIRFTPRLTVH